MMRVVFWDTWAFIALGDKQNEKYPIAVKVRNQLKESQSRLVTTEAVLTEIANFYSKSQVRIIAQSQINFVQVAVKTGGAIIRTIDATLWQEALNLYYRRPDKDWGHTDCISFVVMRELGITEAFTGDKHFEQAGFTRLVRPDEE